MCVVLATVGLVVEMMDQKPGNLVGDRLVAGVGWIRTQYRSINPM
jgi:hypothetical protein